MSLLLLLTSGGGGGGTTRSVRTTAGTSGVAIAPGWSYAAVADVRAAATGRTANLIIRWYDSTGTLISDSMVDTSTDSTSAWTTLAGMATSPTTACFAAIVVEWEAVVAAEIHYLDNSGLFRLSNPY